MLGECVLLHPGLLVLQTFSPSQPAGTYAIDDKIPSPRLPVASSSYVSSTTPIVAVRCPSVAISNGQLAVFGPPVAKEAAAAAIASVPDLASLTEPTKDAENSVDYDDSRENEELPKLQHHRRASKALADMSNRGADGGSLAIRKRVPPLDLSKMVQEDI